MQKTPFRQNSERGTPSATLGKSPFSSTNATAWDLYRSASITDRLGPAEYAECGTAAFADAAGANDEELSPPESLTPAPEGQAPTGDDPAGSEGPVLGNSGVRQDSGALPKTACCIRAFGIMDFVLLPFAHYETISKEAMEDWARVLNQAATDLADAVEADGDPGRTKNTEIAARWCLGQPQQFFRDTDGRKERKLAQIRMRLTALIRGTSTRSSATEYATATWPFEKSESPSTTRKSAEPSKASNLPSRASCAADCTWWRGVARH